MTDLPTTTRECLRGITTELRCTLHLVRHGQSTWNLERRVQGHQNSPALTDLGRAQAAAAAAELADGQATLLLTSDLTRAAQTADIIGRATGLRPTATTLLREQGLGSLEGLTTGEAGAALAGMDLSDPETPYGDGESRRDVLDRFRKLLASPLVADQSLDAQIIMVSHGDTIRIATAHLLGEDPVVGPWREISNGWVVTVHPARSQRAADNADSRATTPDAGR